MSQRCRVELVELTVDNVWQIADAGDRELHVLHIVKLSVICINGSDVEYMCVLVMCSAVELAQTVTSRTAY